MVVACVGGGSNAAGMFYPFVEHTEVELVGVEAGGRSDQPGDHAAPLTYGQPGVLHGSYSYVMQDDDGQTCDVHSISAGLDYPGVGPEHSYWKDTGRVRYTNCRDDEALAAFDALRTSRRHSAGARKLARRGQGDASSPRAASQGRSDRRLPLRPRRQRCGGNRAAEGRAIRLVAVSCRSNFSG